MPAEESQPYPSPLLGFQEGFILRAIVFANGALNDPEPELDQVQPEDLLIAADGGLRHIRALGRQPDVIIGDLDSVEPEAVATLEAAGVEIQRYPARKDFTDLELALLLARERGADDILVLGALGLRWDMTLANLLLPAAARLAPARVRLIDGWQEISLLQAGRQVSLRGRAGDTVSLIPLSGDAHGVITHGLEYPLRDETLLFGATRGISNILLADEAHINLREGLLLCIVIHQPPNNHGGSIALEES